MQFLKAFAVRVRVCPLLLALLALWLVPGAALAQLPRVAIVAAASIAGSGDPRFTDPQLKLMSTGYFSGVDIINVATPNPTPTLATLLDYDAVLVWSNSSFVSGAEMGDVLADYVDAGRGVVLAAFTVNTVTTNRYLTGRWLTGNYPIIVPQSGSTTANSLLGTISLPGHPIMVGVSSLNSNTGSRPTGTALTSHGARVADWADGRPLAAISTTFPRRVDLGMYPPSSAVNPAFWDESTDGARLLANALVYASGGGGPTSAPPTGTPAASWSGILSRGTEVLLSVATTPGTNPTSTDTAVTADLAIFGGADGTTMFDDGPGGGHGDLTAGDGTFSLTFTVPPAQPGGPAIVRFHITDSNTIRTSSPQILLTVVVPPDATDLETITGPSDTVTLTGIDTGGQIKWFRFTIDSEVSDASTYYLDIDTTSDGILANLDTEIGLYRVTGNLVATDDDDGAPIGAIGFSALSFGQTTPARDYSVAPGQVNGDGRDGVLSAGTYYLAVGCFNTVFNTTAFSVTSTSALTGAFKLNLRTNLPGGPVACSPADLVDGLGVPPGDGFVTGTDADFFVMAYNTLVQRGDGSYYADLTDGFGGGPDGFVTGTDADYFTEKYFLGC